jgi:hypothetical protein
MAASDDEGLVLNRDAATVPTDGEWCRKDGWPKIICRRSDLCSWGPELLRIRHSLERIALGGRCDIISAFQTTSDLA